MTSHNRSPQPRRKRLTAAGVKAAPPGKHHDDHGLFLFVKPTGARSWVQRLTIRGKRCDLGLGGYPLTTLAEARDMAFENRRTARRGGDPRAAKQARAVPTFAEAAETVIALYQPTWKSPTKTAGLWRKTLETYALPVIGAKSVADIDTADVLGVLSPIWTDKPETARKVRQRVGAVLKWAIAERHRTDDPTGDAISKALPRAPKSRTHHRALPYGDVAGAIEAVRGADALTSTKLAFEFLILTASRSGEARQARWDEVDLESATWTVPAERMKAGGSVASLAKGRCVIRGLPVHLMVLRWPDGPVAMPWPRSGRTVRDRRRARRSGPRRQCRPGGRTSRPGPCAARASPRSP